MQIKNPVLITQAPHLKSEKLLRGKKRSQKYTQSWENEFSWLKKDPESDTNAKCIICGVMFFSISSAGVGHVRKTVYYDFSSWNV